MCTIGSLMDSSLRTEFVMRWPLLLGLVGIALGDISDLDPPAGSCFCLTTSGVNVRNAACGAVIGSASLGQCFVSQGSKTGCSLSGTFYQFFSFSFNGPVGWTAGDYLRLGTASECGLPPSFPDEEFRAVFLTTAWNIDWPSTPGGAPSTQQSQLIQYLNLLADANFNAVVFQVRPAADAFYDSPIEPWSRFLTGSQGSAPNPFWDPLSFIVQEAHARGLEVHAWLNPYRANTAGNFDGLAPNHIANVHRELAYVYGSTVYMDPGAEVVVQWLEDVIRDIVSRYNVDGIHFDDYFYPYPIDGVEFPDDATYAEYIQGGGSLSLADWRRDNINRMVERVYYAIKDVRPACVFSISPFGIYRPGHPEGMPPPIAGLDPYEALYADAKLWLQQGWVDAMVPQIYWAITPPAQSYPVILDWWLDNNPAARHIYAANGVYKIDDANNWPVSEITNQVEVSRDPSRRDLLSLGNIFYSARFFRDDTKGIYTTFSTSVYPNVATTPPMPWLPFSAPATPRSVQASRDRVSWDLDWSVSRWVVYRLDGDKWTIVHNVAGDVRSVKAGPGVYAVRAMNQARVLSEPVIVSIPRQNGLA